MTRNEWVRWLDRLERRCLRSMNPAFRDLLARALVQYEITRHPQPEHHGDPMSDSTENARRCRVCREPLGEGDYDRESRTAPATHEYCVLLLVEPEACMPMTPSSPTPRDRKWPPND
jgi:hypothetical protein